MWELIIVACVHFPEQDLCFPQSPVRVITEDHCERMAAPMSDFVETAMRADGIDVFKTLPYCQPVQTDT